MHVLTPRTYQKQYCSNIQTLIFVPGTYSLEGALQCTPCPSGFYSDTRASKCTSCAAGTYRQESSTSGDCANCAAGTYAPFEQTSVCLDCPRGYYSEEGATNCSPCPTGTAGGSVAGGALADACVNCKAGEYSSEKGLSACKPCPAGTASSTIGAVSALVCEVSHMEEEYKRRILDGEVPGAARSDREENYCGICLTPLDGNVSFRSLAVH